MTGWRGRIANGRHRPLQHFFLILVVVVVVVVRSASIKHDLTFIVCGGGDGRQCYGQHPLTYRPRHLSQKEDRFSRRVVGSPHSQSMCQAEIRSKLRETISPQPINEGYTRPGFFLLSLFLELHGEAMAGHQIRKSPKLKGGSGWSPPGRRDYV